MDLGKEVFGCGGESWDGWVVEGRFSILIFYLLDFNFVNCYGT